MYNNHYDIFIVLIRVCLGEDYINNNKKRIQRRSLFLNIKKLVDVWRSLQGGDKMDPQITTVVSGVSYLDVLDALDTLLADLLVGCVETLTVLELLREFAVAPLLACEGA